jgi:hypothetical protein
MCRCVSFMAMHLGVHECKKGYQKMCLDFDQNRLRMFWTFLELILTFLKLILLIKMLFLFMSSKYIIWIVRVPLFLCKIS